MKKDKSLQGVSDTVKSLKKNLSELESIHSQLEKVKDMEEKKMLEIQRDALSKKAIEINSSVKDKLSEAVFSKTLDSENAIISGKVSRSKKKKDYEKRKEDLEKRRMQSVGGDLYSVKQISPAGLEKETIERIRKRKEDEKNKKEKKKSTGYTAISSKFFSKVSRTLLGKESFKKMEEDLTKANLEFTPVGYMSVILMTTLFSVIAGGFLFFFFLFFNFGATLPIITRATETIGVRFLKVFWILFVVPLGTFLMMYVYPSLEKKSAEFKIGVELPFATIHMSAISGSMINPIKIFEIIISTKEYPALEKEFNKMINEINIYGYDMVSALKNTAENSPSKDLSELLNGLATTITSGGDLTKFFEKRAETLLFDYRIEEQKKSKSAETFMDIYISILIAAPMILMLLMMIMKLSGLGVSSSVLGIATMIIIGVVLVNIFFLTFLQVKRGG